VNRLLSRCRAAFRIAVRKLSESVGCGAFSSLGLEHIDLQLVEVLNHKRNGLFIEAGANDGLTQSNTYYLEKVLGWQGILIEPLPDKAQRCKRNRRKSEVLNTALVGQDYVGETVKISPANLMSVVRDDRFDSSWVDEHLKLGLQVQNLTESPPIEVPASTLQKILSGRGIRHVDFFSLDVEGYELEVLKGIDFDACRFDWMFIETRQENEAQIDQLLGAHRYIVSRTWVNESYANKLYRYREPVKS
jgi:FkbM family methyltransferase